MKKGLFVVWGALLMGLPFVMGCDQSATELEATAPIGVSSEEEAIRYFAANDEFVLNDGILFERAEIALINAHG